MLSLIVAAVLFAMYTLAVHPSRPSSAIVRCALPAAMLPVILGRAPVAARQGATSLLSRVFGSHASLMDAPFLMLPRVVEDEFANALDMLNRAVGGMVHVEMDDKTQVRRGAVLVPELKPQLMSTPRPDDPPTLYPTIRLLTLTT